MPGLESKGAPALEGDYSNWTIYDSFGDSDSVNSAGGAQEGVVNKGETKIIILDLSNRILKVYDIAKKTLSAALVENELWAEGAVWTVDGRTVLGTYWVDVNVSTWVIYIFKNGAIIKSFPASDIGVNNVRAIHFSPSGKYLVVSGYVTATAQMKWVVLVGS